MVSLFNGILKIRFEKLDNGRVCGYVNTPSANASVLSATPF